jgi:hypothetical protein
MERVKAHIQQRSSYSSHTDTAEMFRYGAGKGTHSAEEQLHLAHSHCGNVTAYAPKNQYQNQGQWELALKQTGNSASQRHYLATAAL